MYVYHSRAARIRVRRNLLGFSEREAMERKTQEGVAKSVAVSSGGGEEGTKEEHAVVDEIERGPVHVTGPMPVPTTKTKPARKLKKKTMKKPIKPAAKSSSSTQHVPEQEEEAIALSGIIPNDLIRPTDILLGRGRQHAQWGGNVRFRAIAKERRREYNGCRSKNKTKNGIARDILEAVLAGRDSSLLLLRTANAAAATKNNNSMETSFQSACTAASNTAPPGRFLEQVDILSVKQAGLSADQIHWRVAKNERALEKIKMTLRQKKKKKGKRKRSNSSSASSSSSLLSSSLSSRDEDGPISRGGGRDKRLKPSHEVGGGTCSSLDVKPSTIPAFVMAASGTIPHQITFAGGSSGGSGGCLPVLGHSAAAVGSEGHQLSALVSSLLAGGAPGSTGNIPPPPQQQFLASTWTPIDQNLLLRNLLVAQAQREQQQLQAAARTQLLQSGNILPASTIPPATISTYIDPGSILALSRGQQGPQHQHQQRAMQAGATLAVSQPQLQPPPVYTASPFPPTIAFASPSSAVPSTNVLGPILFPSLLQQLQRGQQQQQPAPEPARSVHVMQAIMNQQRQAACVLAVSVPQQPRLAPQAMANNAAIAGPVSSLPSAGPAAGNQQGQGEQSLAENSIAYRLLLMKALAARTENTQRNPNK